MENKEEFANIAKAMDEEEKSIVVKFIPSDLLWEEIIRRERLERNTLQKVREALRMEEDN